MKTPNPKIKNHLHHAGWVIVDSSTIIQNAWVLAEAGKIKEVYTGKPKHTPKTFTDHGPGIIMPPLVNAHLHLELSALKNQLPMNQGFQTWVAALLEKRQTLGEEKLKQAAKQAITDLKNRGILYIGEISTLGITKELLQNSGLAGVFFQEYLGIKEPDQTNIKKSPTLSISLAGHAPHTTAPPLLKKLKQQTLKRKLPFSIHVAESEAETEFISKKKGTWADFLTSRQIDYKTWNIDSATPVEYLNSLGILDNRTIAVHLLHITNKDIDTIQKTGVRICLCPGSNQNLHQKLPDIEKIIKKGIEPALGTDSLASSDSLDIIDEMTFIKLNYPNLKPETIFNMATKYGAKALGLEHLTGTLEPGKKADFIYLPIETTNKKQIFEKIITQKTGVGR
jgi:aminodeoxyfutalosine deaminase